MLSHYAKSKNLITEDCALYGSTYVKRRIGKFTETDSRLVVALPRLRGNGRNGE